jgi:outer membrane protein insertion porin family
MNKLGNLRRMAIVLGLALAAPVLTVAVGIVTAQVAQAQQIEVRGNQRVEADTIRSYFRVNAGERLDAIKIDEALKALYATGLYEDVRISNAGGRIIVTVVENSTINRVAFEGNRKVTDDTLTNEVQSRARGALSRPVVQSDVQRIVEVYRRQGYFNTRVEPKIINQPNNRVDLVFEITEEEKTTVRKVNFVGNNKFSDWKLRDVITTQQTHWLSWLSNRDVYDPERVAADQEMLRRFYLKNGYADFRVLSATVDMDPASKGFSLTFTVDEGEQYRFGNIEVISNIRDADPQLLRRKVRATPGKTYNAEEVEKSVEEVTIELSRLGYAFAQVRPRGDRDVQGRIINVVFVVEEGARVYIERIQISGNTRTRDHVVRREFDILEGDPYNRVMIDRAERRLNNLGYFKSVRITNEPGSATDRVIVNVRVEEQLTGEFSIGGGYSTADGIIGEVSVGERNFLGRGHYVKIAGQYGQRARGAEFSFTEPYFLDTRVAAGFDLYVKQQFRSEYNPVNTETMGGTLRAGLPLTDDVTLGLRYTIFQRDINADGLSTSELQQLSPAYQSQLNQSALTSQIGYTLTYNTLDQNKAPTTGVYATLSQDFAGLGGDVKLVKTTAEARQFYPITNDLIGMLKIGGGHVMSWGGGDLRLLDRFYQGPDVVRGFAPSGIGPRDIGSPNKDALGGEMYWTTSAEVIFPIGGKDLGLRAALFADAGSVWGYDGPTFFANGAAGAAPFCGPAGTICVADSAAVRASVGASLIWTSPFGPLRFDFAYPVLKEPHDKTQWFRFGAGGKF